MLPQALYDKNPRHVPALDAGRRSRQCFCPENIGIDQHVIVTKKRAGQCSPPRVNFWLIFRASGYHIPALRCSRRRQYSASRS